MLAPPEVWGTGLKQSLASAAEKIENLKFVAGLWDRVGELQRLHQQVAALSLAAVLLEGSSDTQEKWYENQGSWSRRGDQDHNMGQEGQDWEEAAGDDSPVFSS